MTSCNIDSLARKMQYDINVLNMFVDAGHPCFEDIDFYRDAISGYPILLAKMLREDAAVLSHYADILEDGL